MPVDQSLIRGGVWERGTFTVPADVSEERVQLVAHKYMSRFGEALEKMGYQVLWMSQARIDPLPIPEDGDRKRYRMMAWVRQRPVEIHMDIPDELVPEMLQKGMKLTE